MSKEEVKRSNYLGAPHFYNLNLQCRILVDAFGPNIYLVGSCLVKKDFRDVDVRCILPDKDFDEHFIGHHTNAYWSLVCSAISEWLSSRTDLPIDFQIQKQTEADKYSGDRHSLGVINFNHNGYYVAK